MAVKNLKFRDLTFLFLDLVLIKIKSNAFF